jgi:RHS repeat-associated protein
VGWKHYDQAGYSEVTQYSFKGEPLATTRRIRTEYKLEAGWTNNETTNNALLASDVYTTALVYDALGRVVQQTNPEGSVTQPAYLPTGKLKSVMTKLKGETAYTGFVTGITYNSKGQRMTIAYGNGTATAYAYERETFRLTSLVTKRSSDNREMQNISYTYDPVGNITNIIDSSDDRLFNNNQQVDPEMKYAYDALYRLSEATGREHTALSNKKDAYKDTNSFKQSAFANVNDMQKLANYKEKYSYDKAGNLYQLRHYNNTSSLAYTRDIKIDQYTNRAVLVDDPNNPPVIVNYFDANGNQIVLEHLKEISYNYRDNISRAVVIKRPGGTDDAEYYVYDSQGNRVRKVSEKVINTTTGAIEVEDKIYLGGVEIKRIRQQSSLILQRSTLHIMDDRSRIAISHNWSMDTLNRETTSSADLNKNKTRYQYGNHLGSASLELDTTGQIISYEEYTPYGESSMMVGNNQTEVKLKEYRYTGKERDDFTRLYYYGARYYASWLGRWLTTDPKMEEGDSLNLYQFCKNNPVINVDPDGRESDVGDDLVKHKPTVYEKYTKEQHEFFGFVEDYVAYEEEKITKEMDVLWMQGTRPGIFLGKDPKKYTENEKRYSELISYSESLENLKNIIIPEDIKESRAERFWVGFIPVVSGLLNINEALNGQEAITGNPLSKEDRAWRGTMGALDLVLTAFILYKATGGVAGKISSPSLSNNIINVYRVEGLSNTRILVGESGEVIVTGKKTLFLNFGDKARAIEFFNKRVSQGMKGVQIKSFQVNESLLNDLLENAVPEELSKTYSGKPIIVDITKAANQFGLRGEWIKKLQDTIIQGSGK